MLDDTGETISPFTIDSDRITSLTWRFGAVATQPCTTYLEDNNDNLNWVCGIDAMSFKCPPDMKYMWNIIVSYKLAVN